MPEVKSISLKDEKRIVKELKNKGLLEAVNYIRALKNIIDMQNNVIRTAIKKLKE